MSTEKIFERHEDILRRKLPSVTGGVLLCVIELEEPNRIYCALNTKVLATLTQQFRRDVLEVLRKEMGVEPIQ